MKAFCMCTSAHMLCHILLSELNEKAVIEGGVGWGSVRRASERVCLSMQMNVHVRLLKQYPVYIASKHSGRAQPSNSTVFHVLQFPAQTISARTSFDTAQLTLSPHVRFPILLLRRRRSKEETKRTFVPRWCSLKKCCSPKSLKGAKCLSHGKAALTRPSSLKPSSFTQWHF